MSICLDQNYEQKMKKINIKEKLTEEVSRGRKLLEQETGKFFKQKVGQTNIALTICIQHHKSNIC
jgi:hypothetical protein